MVVSNNSLMLNVFSWLAETIIGGFFSIIMTAFTVILEVMSTIFSQFLYFIGISLLKILNFIQSLVRKLVGLETYWWDGAVMDGDLAGQDPVLKLITDPQVLEVFFAMLIIAVVVLIIAVITQLFRLEYTTEGAQNTKGKLFGKAFKALAMFLIVPIGTSMGIIVGNQLLKSLDAATNPSGSAYISGAIFTAAASDANRAEKIALVTTHYVATDQDPASGDESYDSSMVSTPLKDDNGVVITHEDGSIRDSEGRRLIAVSKLSDRNSGYEGVKAWIEQYIGGGFLYDKAEFTEDGGNLKATYTYTPTQLTELAGTEEITIEFTSNRGNLAAQRADIANQIDYEFSSADGKLDYMNVAHVSAFYSLGEINYLILFAATIMALYVLFNVIFGLVLRLYKVAVYFMVSPPIIALMPIYETAFVEWRKAIVGTIISAYSAVVGLNLFIMLLPILKKIELFDPNAHSVYGVSINRGLNSYTYLLIVLAGCFLLKDLIASLSKWIAAEDAFKAGSDVSKKVVSTGAKVAIGGGMAAGMGAKMLGKTAGAIGGDIAKTGVGLAQTASGTLTQARGQRMLKRAAKIDRAGRDDQGRLLPGHRLNESVELKKKAADTFSRGTNRIARGESKIADVNSRTSARVRKVGSSIGNAVASTGGVFRDMGGRYQDTKGAMLSGAASTIRSYMGVAEGNKGYEKLQDKRKKAEETKEADKKLTNQTIKNLNVDKINGSIDAMKGGFENAKVALSKPGGKTEALSIAESLDKVAETLGTGFEHMGDELRKLVLQSKDGTGADVAQQMNALISEVTGKGGDYSVSVNNISQAGMDETKLSKLEDNDKAVLAELKKIQKRKNSK